MFHGLALASLITRCAPDVSPSTMAAIVQVESGGNPYAIDDDTTRRSYYPRDRAAAEALANELIGSGHLIDAGIAQVDSMNFAKLGVSVGTVFDPCTNLRAGSAILASDYDAAQRRYGSGQTALRHAIGMYNTGRLDAGAGYVNKVLAAAGIQEKYGAPGVDVVRDAKRSPVLVAVRISHKASRSVRRVVTPARSPILVSSTSNVVVF